MNILQKFKGEKRYIQLLNHHRDLEDEYKRMKKESVNNICDYIEEITKLKSYKNRILQKFKDDPYHPFYEIAQMSIMIQSLDSGIYRVGSDYRGECEKYIDYSPETFDFKNKELDHFIEEIFREGFYDNGPSDMYYFCIDLAVNPPGGRSSYNNYISVVLDELEYVDDDGYETAYYVNVDFEKGIRALYNCYLELKEDIKQIMLEHIEEERVEF